MTELSWTRDWLGYRPSSRWDARTLTNFLTPEGKLDILKARPLARLGYYDYTSVTDIFEMRIPNASAAEADGLEGAPA